MQQGGGVHTSLLQDKVCVFHLHTYISMVRVILSVNIRCLQIILSWNLNYRPEIKKLVSNS